MKSKTRLDSAVFQLTPTRTRCDLYIIANDKKEKIASGLLNPFIAHLKTAQDQIAEGGYSVLLQPEANSNATWFTKFTVESFVRFVSTPEILERVYTIESEILQIEEAIAIQGNNDIMQIEDQQVKPLAINEGNKPGHGHDADEDKAIVLYKPGAHETSGSIPKEGNSKVQLLNVLETRKTVLKKEQGMAFARAVAAGFEIDHVANLLSFAECFGASRLLNACLRFIDLWKQKHESGQWVEIEPDAISTKSDYSAINASGIVLSSHNNETRSEATTPETKEKTSTDPNSAGQQQYHPGQFPHPVFPPWAMQTSPGAVPVYQAYHMQGLSPYYQHYPGNGPFYPPPYSPMEDPNRTEQKRQSMDNSESGSVNEERKSGKKKSGKVVIRNINFINSKRQDSSEDDVSASDTDTESENDRNKKTLKSPKRKGKKESESENSHWDAFQSFILKGAEEGGNSNEDMFSMERNPKIKRQQKMINDDPISHGGHDHGGVQGDKVDVQSYERNGRKIVYKNGNDDFMVGKREQGNLRNSPDPLANYEYKNGNRNESRDSNDEAFMVSVRSSSGVNESRITSINMDYEIPRNGQSQVNKVSYEPHDLSLMRESSIENRLIGYDPALDHEMQVAEGGGVKKVSDVKKVTKSGEKGNLVKKNVGPVRKVRPSKVNNALEDARVRAEKLRLYKADLQKMKKEQQEADLKRLEALKIERQKRIAARANSNSIPNQPTRKSLPSKLSPMSHKPSKFTDSEPGSSSPLQRSKIRPTSIGSTNSKKPSTTTKLINGSPSSANNRMTRSLSSMSDTKKEVNSITPESKPSIKNIRRLSEPKKVNNNTTSTTKSTSKIAAIVSLDQNRAASLPELKIKTSKVSLNVSEKVSKMKEDKAVSTSGIGKVDLNESDADENRVIDKGVVMQERKETGVDSRVNKGFEEDCVAVHKVEIVDKGTISIQPQIHSSSSEVRKNSEVTESSGEKSYQAPYARVSSFEDPSTRNSEYAKAPQTNFISGGTEKAYISDFNNLKLEKIPEVLEKPQVKEAKGFRRLLKLGKKSHSPSDVASGNGSQPDNGASSGGVHTLKTLIFEDQAPSHSQKSSRHFSLLSSFRGDKKATP